MTHLVRIRSYDETERSVSPSASLWLTNPTMALLMLIEPGSSSPTVYVSWQKLLFLPGSCNSTSSGYQKTADPTVYGFSQVAGLGFEPRTSGLWVPILKCICYSGKSVESANPMVWSSQWTEDIRLLRRSEFSAIVGIIARWKVNVKFDVLTVLVPEPID